MRETDQFAGWIGRKESMQDLIIPGKVSALAATLDCEYPLETGTPLPPAWHWVFFNPVSTRSELGPDGHPKKGGFLPPIDLPRRMWAGGRLAFKQPLVIGETIERVSTIKDISFKSGQSGNLAFVTVEHVIKGSEGGHVIEQHDIVYRAASKPGTPKPQGSVTPDQAPYAWSERINPDSVLLFRYSALTFNGHRIHYDREYCIGEEGYPGLVVHGPLTATLLLELVRHRSPEERIKQFKFRALRPLFDTEPYTVHGRREGNKIHLWALDPTQQRAMEAVAELWA